MRVSKTKGRRSPTAIRRKSGWAGLMTTLRSNGFTALGADKARFCRSNSAPARGGFAAAGSASAMAWSGTSRSSMRCAGNAAGRKVGQHFEGGERGVFAAVNSGRAFGIPSAAEPSRAIAAQHLLGRLRVFSPRNPPHLHVGIPCAMRPRRSMTSWVPFGLPACASGVSPPRATAGWLSHSKAS